MTEETKKPIRPYIGLGVFLAYACHWLVKLYEESPDSRSMGDLLGTERINYMFDHWTDKSLLDISPSFWSLMAALCGVLFVLFRYMKKDRTGTFRTGEEYGSARFATIGQLAGFRDKEDFDNIIYTQQARMSLFNFRLPFKFQLNKNVLVIGGTGDWKTRAFVKPNLLQGNSSFVVTDTKGLIVHEVGHALKTLGYKIKVFSLLDFSNSDQFNVFRYMTKETDIDKVAEAIVTATKRSDNQGEDFWAQAEMLLMRALIGYLYFDSKKHNYMPNLSQVSDMLRRLSRKNPKVASPLERLFDQLEKEQPGNYASKQWQLFNKNFQGKTRDSVAAVASARFAVFDHQEVRDLIARDTLDIDKWQQEKTAVFIHIPETDKAYQFLSALLFQTIFETAIRAADKIIMGEVPGKSVDDLLHLQIMGDEIAQVGKIPNLPEVMSVIRSREISAKLMIQSFSQLQTIYGDKETKTILNNCGSLLYLGSNDKDTLEELSVRAGKQTINDTDSSRSYGQHGSSSVQEKKLARDLMTPHEIATVGIEEALLFISKQNVFRDKKYDLAQHPRYPLHANRPTDETWYRYHKYTNPRAEFEARAAKEIVHTVTVETVETHQLPPQLA